MNKLITEFNDIRTKLINNVDQMTDVYFSLECEMVEMYFIIDRCSILLANDLENIIKEYPEFPKEYVPQVKFNFIYEEDEIETHTQVYFNEDQNLIFLGNQTINNNI